MSKSNKIIKDKETGLVIIILGLFFEVLIIILMIMSIFSSGKFVGFIVWILLFFCFLIIPGLLLKIGVKKYVLSDVFILFSFTFFFALIGFVITMGIYLTILHSRDISEYTYLLVFLGSFTVGFIISNFITLCFHISR